MGSVQQTNLPLIPVRHLMKEAQFKEGVVRVEPVVGWEVEGELGPRDGAARPIEVDAAPLLVVERVVAGEVRLLASGKNASASFSHIP